MKTINPVYLRYMWCLFSTAKCQALELLRYVTAHFDDLAVSIVHVNTYQGVL